MFEDKTFANLSDLDILTLHLSRFNTILLKDVVVQSTLNVVISEARSSLFRRNTKNILPLLGCFAALDQLSCYYDIQSQLPKNYTDGILASLYSFTNPRINLKDIDTLYALRNGLVHNASLVCVHNKKWYCFRYSKESDQIVVYPETEWDGKLSSLSIDKITLINPEKLLKTTEECISIAKDLLDAKRLSIRKRFTSQQIKAQFLMPILRDHESD